MKEQTYISNGGNFVLAVFVVHIYRETRGSEFPHAVESLALLLPRYYFLFVKQNEREEEHTTAYTSRKDWHRA